MFVRPKMGYVRAKIGLTGQFDRHQPGNYLQPCLYFVNWNGIVLATFQARPVPKKNSFNPQFRWTFFLKHFQLEQTYPHSFRLQFKSFCLPQVHVWTLNNTTLFYRESRSVMSVSPNQHRKHFPAVQSEILLLNLFIVLSGLNIFSSKPTSILH